MYRKPEIYIKFQKKNQVEECIVDTVYGKLGCVIFLVDFLLNVNSLIFWDT